MINAIEILRHFAAQKAACNRMRRVAAQACGFAV
jgi:hypothetical protein